MKGITKKIISVLLAVALIVSGIVYTPGPETVKASYTKLEGGTCNEGKIQSYAVGSSTAGERLDNVANTDYYNYVRGSGVSALASPSASTSDTVGAAANAIDHNETTRWLAANNDGSQWITVDLGRSYPVSKIFVCWEVASASEYHIAVSNNGTDFETVATLTNMPKAGDNTDNKRARTDKLTLNNTVDARYVKICIDKRMEYDGSQGAPSIWEIGIYGTEAINLKKLSGATCDNGTVESWELGNNNFAEKFSDKVDALNNYVRFSGVSAVANNATNSYLASKAIDNKADTRWAYEDKHDGHYITVDLQHSYPVSKIFVCWETASASAYHIEVSNDGANYTTVATLTNMPKAGDNSSDPAKRARTDKLILNKEVYARYVKIYVDSRTAYSGGTQYGASIWEIGIYGREVQASETNSFTDTNNLKTQSDNTGVLFDDILDATYYNYVRYNGVSAKASNHESNHGEEGAIDNKIGTDDRWSSDSGDNGGDNSWIRIDLGAKYSISKVFLSWEQANATVYNIYKSTDDQEYSLITTVNANALYYDGDRPTVSEGARADKVSFTEVSARYIKIQAVQRCYKDATRTEQYNGMSLFEIGIYGTEQEKPYSMQAFPEFKAGSTQTIGNKLEAEDFINAAGGVIKEEVGTVSGQNIGGCDHERWVQYNINFDRKTSKIYFRNSAQDHSGEIQIFLDDSSMSGDPVAEVIISKTDSWESYMNTSANVEIPAGNHKVYFKFVSDDRVGAVCNIDYFKFEYKPEKVAVPHEAEKAHAYVRGSAGKVANTKLSSKNYSNNFAVGEMNTWYDHDRSYLTTYVKADYTGNYELAIAYSGQMKTLLQYRVNNAETWTEQSIDTVDEANWDSVNTVQVTVQLQKGINKIDISGAVWKTAESESNEKLNIDRFVLESLTYYAFNDRDTSLVGNKIEAEAYNQSWQMADKPLSQDKNGSLSGGGNLGGTRNGNYARYNVYFDRRTSKVKFLYSANNEATGNIEIYVDGITENNLVGKIHTHSTSTDDQWTNYQELSGELDRQIEQGEHIIYLKFVPDNEYTYVANIDYFQFEYTPQKINNKNKHINNEAEDAHTYMQGSSAGSYAIEKHINYSGGKAVKDMKTMTDAERSYFTTYVNAKTAGDYILTIAYGTKSKSAHLDYSVNGNGDGSDNEQWTSLETPTTGAYDTVKKVKAKVTLKKGINIIDISGAISDSGDDYLNIDYFRLDKVTEDVNLALGKPVQSCTYQVNDTEGSFIPGNAVDGDDSTQWAANKAGDNWLAIDLEEAYEIEEVKILFGTAYASDFEIQISNDDRVWDAPDNSDAWITARTVTNYLEGNALSDGTTSTQWISTDWTSAGVGEFGYLCLGKARYIRIKVNNVGGGHENASIFEFKVYGKRITDDNLALKKRVTASSSTGDKAKYAVDGDNSTRWGSQTGAVQWYQVDLGKESILNSVDIKFERDYPINFTISILNENGTWEEVYRAEGWSEPGEQKNITDKTKKLGYSIHLDGVKARYIKIEGTELNQKGWSGMSIWEFEVWGQEVDKEYYWEEQAQKTYGIYPISESDYNKNAIESQVDKDRYPVLDPTLVQGAVLGTGDTYEVLYEANKKIYFYVNPYNIYLYDNAAEAVSHGTVAWSGEEAVSGEDYNPSVAKLIENKFNKNFTAASVCYQLPDKDTFNTLLEKQNRADYITTEIKCQVTGVDKDKNLKSAEITFRLKIIKSSLSIKDTIMKDGCIHVDTGLSYGINNDSADGVTYEWQRSDEGITWESVSEKRYDLSIISNNGQDVNVANDIGGGKYYRVRAVKGTDFGEWSHPYHIPYYNEVQNGGFEEPEMYSTDDPNRKFPFNSNSHGGLQQYPNGYKGLFWKTTGPGCWNKTNKMQIGHDIEIVNARHLLVDENDQVNRFSVTKAEMYTDDNGTLKTHNHNNTGKFLDHGNQFAELNAENTGALYQDILTTPSSTCVWALDHAGRRSKNTMLVVAMSTKVATEKPSQTEPDSIIAAVQSYETKEGPLPTEEIDAYNNGTTISANGIEFTVWRVTSDDYGKWSCHTGTYKVSDSTDNYLTRFFFVSEVGHNNDNTIGNLLDNVSFETVKPYTIEYWVKGESDTDYQQVAIINKTALPYDRVNIPLTISEIQNSGGTINDGYNNLNLYSYTLTRAVMNENLYDIQYDQDGKSQMTVAAYHDHLILYYDYATISVTKKIEGLKQNDIPVGYTIDFTIKYKDSDGNKIGEDVNTLSVADLEWVYADGDAAEGYLANMKFEIPSDVIKKAGGGGIKYEVVETLRQVPKLEGTNYYLEQVKAGVQETNISTNEYFGENAESRSYSTGNVIYKKGESNSVRFVNVYNSIRKVTVTKNVDCKFLEEYPFKDDRAFEFTLNVTKDNNPISAAKYGDGIVADETEGSYQFKLKHGESVDLYVLAGCDVTVQEADYSQAGYEAIAWNAEGATASTDVVDANDKIGRKVILSEISAETLLTCKNIKVYYGDVEVQGFQMNTDTSKGGVSEYSPSFRVVSRACKRLIGSDGKLHNVKAYGTIYSLDSNVNGNYNEKMRLYNAANSDQIYGTDEFSSAIYYFESKVGTYIDWTTGQPEDPYYNYFALTFVRKSYSYPWLNTNMAFRAYARLDNGEIVYGTKVYTVNIYEIADNLYQNTKMGTKKAHEFLYTNVLNLVTMEQNRVDICFSMLYALQVPNAQDERYTTINTINKDIVDYVYCQKDYTYQEREEFSPKSLSGVEISALLSALNGVKAPATTYNTLFDWIYNETENYKSYKGFYKKVPYDWDNSIYMKSKTQ